MSNLYDTLSELREKRGNLDKAIKAIEAVVADMQPPNEPALHEGPTIKEILSTTPSSASAITNVLETRGKPLSPSEIVAGLGEMGYRIGGENKLRSVNASLARGKANGIFTNPERGQWGLAEWETTDEPTAPEQRAVLPLSAPLASSGQP